MSTPTLSSEVLSSGSVIERAAPARISALRPLSPVPTYVGIALVLLGFAIVGVAWGQIASETDVAMQLPYLVSGGIMGLGIIQVGLVVINVAAKRREGALREQQTAILNDALIELRETLRDDQARR